MRAEEEDEASQQQQQHHAVPDYNHNNRARPPRPPSPPWPPAAAAATAAAQTQKKENTTSWTPQDFDRVSATVPWYMRHKVPLPVLTHKTHQHTLPKPPPPRHTTTTAATAAAEWQQHEEEQRVHTHAMQAKAPPPHTLQHKKQTNTTLYSHARIQHLQRDPLNSLFFFNDQAVHKRHPPRTHTRHKQQLQLKAGQRAHAAQSATAVNGTYPAGGVAKCVAGQQQQQQQPSSSTSRKKKKAKKENEGIQPQLPSWKRNHTKRGAVRAKRIIGSAWQGHHDIPTLSAASKAARQYHRHQAQTTLPKTPHLPYTFRGSTNNNTNNKQRRAPAGTPATTRKRPFGIDEAQMRGWSMTKADDAAAEAATPDADQLSRAAAADTACTRDDDNNKDALRIVWFSPPGDSTTTLPTANARSQQVDAAAANTTTQRMKKETPRKDQALTSHKGGEGGDDSGAAKKERKKDNLPSIAGIMQARRFMSQAIAKRREQKRRHQQELRDKVRQWMTKHCKSRHSIARKADRDEAKVMFEYLADGKEQLTVEEVVAALRLIGIAATVPEIQERMGVDTVLDFNAFLNSFFSLSSWDDAWRGVVFRRVHVKHGGGAGTGDDGLVKKRLLVDWTKRRSHKRKSGRKKEESEKEAVCTQLSEPNDGKHAFRDCGAAPAVPDTKASGLSPPLFYGSVPFRLWAPAYARRRNLDTLMKNLETMPIDNTFSKMVLSFEKSQQKSKKRQAFWGEKQAGSIVDSVEHVQRMKEQIQRIRDNAAKVLGKPDLVLEPISDVIPEAKKQDLGDVDGSHIGNVGKPHVSESSGAKGNTKEQSPSVAKPETMPPNDPVIQASCSNDWLHLASMLVAMEDNEKRFAYVNRKDKNGSTALFHAIWRDNAEVLQVLLFHSADPNIQNNRKNTALHLACEKAHIRSCEILLAHGAVVGVMNTNHNTCLDMVPRGAVVAWPSAKEDNAGPNAAKQTCEQKASEGADFVSHITEKSQFYAEMASENRWPEPTYSVDVWGTDDFALRSFWDVQESKEGQVRDKKEAIADARMQLTLIEQELSQRSLSQIWHSTIEHVHGRDKTARTGALPGGKGPKETLRRRMTRRHSSWWKHSNRQFAI